MFFMACFVPDSVSILGWMLIYMGNYSFVLSFFFFVNIKVIYYTYLYA